MNDKTSTDEQFWEWVDTHKGQDSARLRLSTHPTSFHQLFVLPDDDIAFEDSTHGKQVYLS